MKNNEIKKLNLGCGLNAPNDWINLDGSWNAWLAKNRFLLKLLKISGLLPKKLLDIKWPKNVIIHNVKNPLPFKDFSFSSIYSSHLLEHLYLNEAKNLLKECFRALQPGGIMRIVVPDLKIIIQEYNENKRQKTDNFNPADILSKHIFTWEHKPYRNNFAHKIYDAINNFHSHKWMYDADSLIDHFKKAGFQDVKEMEFQQSRIKEIKDIEEPGRILNGAGICIEGIKPIKN